MAASGTPQDGTGTYHHLGLNMSALSDLTSNLLEMVSAVRQNATAFLVDKQSAPPGHSNPSPHDFPEANDDGDNVHTDTFQGTSGYPHTPAAIALLSLLFFVIVLVGIVGNALVVFAVLADRKMRQSVTNLLILNLAVADLVMLVLGVPEIVQSLLLEGGGWRLGPLLCRVDRFLLVVCLYVSVLSLVSVCVERFVAIVFPIKAHVVCTRRKMLCVIAVIWPLSLLCGLPTAVFNQLTSFPGPGPSHADSGQRHCVILFPEPQGRRKYLLFKLTESSLFYFLPLLVQVALYSVVARRLYASMQELHSGFQLRPVDPSTAPLNGQAGDHGRHGDSWTGEGGSERAVETIRARKGVVKMLVASVAVYAVSYSPHQVHLLHDAVSDTPLPDTWTFFVLAMVLTHLNSAANPVLYCIFSHKFRQHFHRCLCCLCLRRQSRAQRGRLESFLDSRGVWRRASTTKTVVTQV